VLLFFLEGVFSGKGVLPEKAEPSHASGRSANILFAFLLAVSIAGAVRIIADARTGRMPAEERSFLECNDWVRRNTPEDSVILSRKPAYTKLCTGRPTVGYMFFESPGKLFNYILENKVDYMIMGDLGLFAEMRRVISAMLEEYFSSFQTVYKSKATPESHVYKVRHR
jgi:hypothetical protein